MELATLAGGCFWCTEAIFQKLKGVKKVTPGYTGGSVENPTYEQVCSGTTGHAEAIQLEFDPEIITFEKLLEVFFELHDPTTLNQQGADVGTQYRSAIFYHSEEQKKAAADAVKKLEKSDKFKSRIVTEIVPFTKFYQAENYHQNYFENNRTAPYCQVVIDPKIKKLYEEFEELTPKREKSA